VHPYLKKNQIPSDMVTASGSLDPNISPQGVDSGKTSGSKKKSEKIK
jgi:K+-transporting ATPase ATPase C chain